MLNKYFDRLRDEYLRDPTPTNMGIAIQACASAVGAEFRAATTKPNWTAQFDVPASEFNPRTLEAMRQELVLLAFDRLIGGMTDDSIEPAKGKSRGHAVANATMVYVNEMLAAMAADQVPSKTE